MSLYGDFKYGQAKYGGYFNAPTFLRNSTAYNFDGSLIAINQPRLQPAKFNNGILIENSATNEFTNSIFVNSTGWLGAGGALSVSSNILSLTGSGSIVNPNVTHTTSCIPANGHKIYVRTNQKVTNSSCLSLRLYYDATTGGAFHQLILIPNPVINTTYTMSSIYTLGATYTGFIRFYLYEYYVDAATANGKVMQVYEPMCMDLTAIFGAGNEPNLAWCDGITFANISRASEMLSFPTRTVLSVTQGTLEQQIILDHVVSPTEQFIFDAGGTTNNNLQLVIKTNGILEARYGTGSSTLVSTGATILVANTRYAVALKWSVSGVEVLLNGIYEANNASAPTMIFGVNAFIGSRADGALQLDGVIDDLRISSIARLDADILTAYNTSQPLPVDQYTSYKLPFDTTINQTQLYMPSYTALSYFNFNDYNIAEFNTRAVADLMNVYGYNITLATSILNRDMFYLDFWDSLNRIEGNILAIQQSLSYVPLGWIAPVTNWYYNMPFDFNTANRWQIDINSLFVNINNIITELIYCGAPNTICGMDSTYF